MKTDYLCCATANIRKGGKTLGYFQYAACSSVWHGICLLCIYVGIKMKSYADAYNIEDYGNSNKGAGRSSVKLLKEEA